MPVPLNWGGGKGTRDGVDFRKREESPDPTGIRTPYNSVLRLVAIPTVAPNFQSYLTMINLFKHF